MSSVVPPPWTGGRRDFRGRRPSVGPDELARIATELKAVPKRASHRPGLARRLAAQHGVSVRTVYRYANAGPDPLRESIAACIFEYEEHASLMLGALVDAIARDIAWDLRQKGWIKPEGER